MPVQLRQRLDCHYCGRRSKHVKKPNSRFTCENCLAVNFFDENGEIADVPVEEAAPAQQRFAQPVRSDPLADDFSSHDSIFCSTCIKNQQLYTYNLSQFLPDPDHPEYEKFEAQLPEYKKGLERRYPQCCARCEPKVRAQLHQATYNARSDHLRRVLEKSRQRRISSRLGWRSLLITAAGVGYFTSLAMQLVWHLYGSQLTSRQLVKYQIRGLGDCVTHRPFVPQCLDLSEPLLIGISIDLGFATSWWNPKWQLWLSMGGQDGQLSGLAKYYLVQYALLGLRIAACALTTDMSLNPKLRSMLHACFAVAITLVAGWSVFGIIQVRTKPPVNWQQDPAPLLSSDQFVPPSEPSTADTQQDQQGPFSVGSLSASQAPTYRAWRPPTPPDEAADSMDWTPSQPVFQPELKEVRYRSTKPSPFHGTLPALNAKGLHKSAAQTTSAQKEAIGLPPGFFDRPSNPALPSRPTKSASDAIAQPRFFGYDKDADTGLESIFGTVFSLQDRSLDPVGPSQGPTSNVVIPNSPSARFSQLDQKRRSSLSTPKEPPTPSARFSAAAFGGLVGAVAWWIFDVTVWRDTSSELGYYIVLFSIALPTGHLLLLLLSSTSRAQGGGGPLPRILLFTCEALVLLGLAMLREKFGELYRDLWNKLGIAAVGLLLPQEFLQHHQTRPSASNPEHDIHQTPAAAAIDELSERGTGRDLPVEPTTPRPGLGLGPGRRDSSESVESQSSIATTSTVWDSAPQTLSRGRYELYESSPSKSHTPTRRSNPGRGGMMGIDGLSLNDGGFASTSRRPGGPASTNTSGRGWGLESSGTNIAGPRARRKF
ncbi:hypothetical protein ABEF95_009661 [Exophiala dermatitidis]